MSRLIFFDKVLMFFGTLTLSKVIRFQCLKFLFEYAMPKFLTKKTIWSLMYNQIGFQLKTYALHYTVGWAQQSFPYNMGYNSAEFSRN